MDIGALSMVMSQSRVQQTAGIALTKMALDVSKDSATQMTEIIRNIALSPNIGNQIDISV
ncbi:hypothetical protein J2Z76_001562 [Sedimentibacter acidaminivorans]|uniref:Motility protein n=1 Tax=Sedimentibacter acidaminivorans TaxID=913099 RepID=A0ABS4GDD7_9FIRM|nr:YjfB family protein [Sedimentibacter acidaminivorans]MBP1925701.1 hypothetical protein [Sedimentibacter acidaminivorans]